jgi:PAS domain-containing protein
MAEFTSLNGKPFLRLMQPMYTLQGCLKCHAHQGYKAGDIRGGVSVAVPMAKFLDNANLFALQLDQKGNITYANKFLLSETGWQRHEINGKDWLNLFIPEENRQKIRSLHQKNLSQNEIQKFPETCLCRQGAWNYRN